MGEGDEMYVFPIIRLPKSCQRESPIVGINQYVVGVKCCDERSYVGRRGWEDNPSLLGCMDSMPISSKSRFTSPNGKLGENSLGGLDRPGN